MGEKSLPARKGREVRGDESIKLRADASTLHWWERAPLPTGLTARGTPPPRRFAPMGEVPSGWERKQRWWEISGRPNCIITSG